MSSLPNGTFKDKDFELILTFYLSKCQKIAYEKIFQIDFSSEIHRVDIGGHQMDLTDYLDNIRHCLLATKAVLVVNYNLCNGIDHENYHCKWLALIIAHSNFFHHLTHF